MTAPHRRRLGSRTAPDPAAPATPPQARGTAAQRLAADAGPDAGPDDVDHDQDDQAAVPRPGRRALGPGPVLPQDPTGTQAVGRRVRAALRGHSPQK